MSSSYKEFLFNMQELSEDTGVPCTEHYYNYGIHDEYLICYWKKLCFDPVLGISRPVGINLNTNGMYVWERADAHRCELASTGKWYLAHFTTDSTYAYDLAYDILTDNYTYTGLKDRSDNYGSTISFDGFEFCNNCNVTMHFGNSQICDECTVIDQDHQLLKQYIHEWATLDRKAPPQVSISLESFLDWYSADYVQAAISFIKLIESHKDNPLFANMSLNKFMGLQSSTIKDKLGEFPIFKKLHNMQLKPALVKQYPELPPDGTKRIKANPDTIYVRFDMKEANHSSLRFAHTICDGISPDDYTDDTWEAFLQKELFAGNTVGAIGAIGSPMLLRRLKLFRQQIFGSQVTGKNNNKYDFFPKKQSQLQQMLMRRLLHSILPQLRALYERSYPATDGYTYYTDIPNRSETVSVYRLGSDELVIEFNNNDKNRTEAQHAAYVQDIISNMWSQLGSDNEAFMSIWRYEITSVTSLKYTKRSGNFQYAKECLVIKDLVTEGKYRLSGCTRLNTPQILKHIKGIPIGQHDLVGRDEDGDFIYTEPFVFQ